MEQKPLLCVIHDDANVRGPLSGDLRERFGVHYELEAYGDGASALESLRRHAAEGRRVAAVFGADGAAGGRAGLPAELRELHPRARRVLMVGRGEWNRDHPAVEAMRTGRAESYIFVPWGPRERWLYLPVTEILADWEASEPPAYEAAQLIGEVRDPRARALRELFSQLGIPLGFYGPGSEQARRVFRGESREHGVLPVLAFRGGTVLADPSQKRIAQALGFATEPEGELCDLAIIGAGPAGLAAAVYGASEGLATVVIDHGMPGGQAGTSSRIRNYLGFPTGLSGRDLANRALEQAWFFGARVVLSKHATGIRPVGSECVVELADGPVITARTVIIATGVSWRRLGVHVLEAFHGAGVYYGAAASDGAVDGAEVFIVGAGNSAGQAAVHLARSAASVTLLVRGEGLSTSMSDYLVRELDHTANIRIRLQTEVVGGVGTNQLAGLTLRDKVRGTTEDVAADALYVMIGGDPHTDWLAGTLARDDQGYLLTGGDVAQHDGHRWPLDRPPMLLETSLPGVFAAGDVRHDSIKRVAAAVGAGSTAVQLVHLRLRELA